MRVYPSYSNTGGLAYDGLTHHKHTTTHIGYADYDARSFVLKRGIANAAS